MLAVQWVVGFRMLVRFRRTLLVATLASTLYLSVGDEIAIRSGIWVLHSDRLVGLRLGEVPVEEVLFFLLTNLMIVQTVILAKRLPWFMAHSAA